jgi:phosphoglycerol transferase MdoB-like AlkP superfamily enzyme
MNLYVTFFHIFQTSHHIVLKYCEGISRSEQQREIRNQYHVLFNYITWIWISNLFSSYFQKRYRTKQYLTYIRSNRKRLLIWCLILILFFLQPKLPRIHNGSIHQSRQKFYIFFIAKNYKKNVEGLQLWKHDQDPFAFLWIPIRSILSVPAATSTLESKLTVASIILNKRRTSLQPDKIEKPISARSVEKYS